MCAVTFLTTRAFAVKVRVLAATHLEGRAERDPASASGVVLRGTLRDDVGAPIPNSHVAISIHAEGGAGAPLPLPRAERCAPRLAPEAHDPHVAPDEYVVDTDAGGAFCVRSAIGVIRGVLRLRFQGGAFFEKSETDFPFDLGRPLTRLTFEPEPRIVSLDRPTYAQGVRVTSLGTVAGDWHLTLRDERAKVLGTAVAGSDGYARIEVRTEDFAGPGRGELSAELDGAPLGAGTAIHTIERHARVELALAGAPPEGDPEEGIAIAVQAATIRGDVPTGVVEVTIGGQPVGAARVQNGRAKVVARFGAGRAGRATAAVHYLPDTPWLEPGDALPVTLQIRPPSPWRRAPIVLLALALAAWMARAPLLARLRAPRRKSARTPLREEHAEIQVLRPREASGDWTGRVFDAHDGGALARATVSIVVPVFPGQESSGILARTTTSASGSFELPTMKLRGDARLRVESPLHATFEEPLPAPAELAIPLVSRRRRLLERLVHWAGREWGEGALADPTPAQVALRAGADATALEPSKRERADRVKSWARAVEQTVFDRAEVDERAERNVVTREPSPQGSYADVAANPPAAIPPIPRS
jgi:hypothetical protein